MMGNPCGKKEKETLVSSVRAGAHGYGRPGLCLRLPHLRHQFFPGAVGMGDEMVGALQQLPIVELLIRELEDVSMGSEWESVA